MRIYHSFSRTQSQICQGAPTRIRRPSEQRALRSTAHPLPMPRTHTEQKLNRPIWRPHLRDHRTACDQNVMRRRSSSASYATRRLADHYTRGSTTALSASSTNPAKRPLVGSKELAERPQKKHPMPQMARKPQPNHPWKTTKLPNSWGAVSDLRLGDTIALR